MSDISEEEWKEALLSIMEELNEEQFEKLLFRLTDIPTSQKKNKSKQEMAQKILEHYGLKKSISVIDDAMDWIPRKDPRIQNLLRPFVDKLKNEHENGHKTVKITNDSVEGEERSSTGLKRNIDQVEGEETSSTAVEIKNDSVEEEERSSTDQQKSCQPDRTNTFPWKIPICDLKPSSDFGDILGIIGKVVQKSALRTYNTRDDVKKYFFYLSIADETGSIKIMVYGKTLYKEIHEDKSYLFTDLKRDEINVKVTSQSKVSETKTVIVPEEHEMEARKLIYPESPLYPIAEAKSFADKTEVSVEGTVTKIDLIKKKKVNRQDFQLKDKTDSIMISMWRDHTKQCKELSVGDIIKITNMKISKYFKNTSLNSTGFTKIHKVQSVGVHNVTIQIIGIAKAIKKETHLDAEVNGLPHRLVVGSPLLAKAFGLNLDDLKESLLEKLPLFANAEIHGSKIKKLQQL
ncbi:uncharacterized protein LOC113744337 isoform X1 [Larimichthys crocea]|uniref:uncharacterized protein LOC113744337 isoform X1 n=1 Tax=Larimichthys crocea TaxID=215358 RepID=UPI000F5E5222|nr:uncharacterized protein LOC113744337 isoform X1 [Larimichthys crocea]XP_027129327.1 uncharacterized protein LOC113744337 isoform X1 [Larimichthys crocea]